MPEHLKALIFITAIAIVIFSYLKKLTINIIDVQEFKRWRNAWLAVTFILFLSHNFWLFIVVTGLYLIQVSSQQKNKPALFFALLLAAPALESTIPGMGIINYLVKVDYTRVLILVVLFPLYFTMPRNSKVSFGKYLPDKILAVYLALLIALQFRDTTFTDALRQSIYYFIDVFIPYFVISRALNDMNKIRTAMLGFVFACMIIAAIGSFETVRGWILYNPLESVLGADPTNLSRYLIRGGDGALRAQVTTGQAIVMGYVMLVSLGFYLHLQKLVLNKTIRSIGYLILLLGIIAPYSRGPWVGAYTMLLVYLALGPSPMKNLTKVGMISVMCLLVLSATPYGAKVVDMLPFIGKSDVGNIEYREQLIQNSMKVISRNPWFGDADYEKYPEMQAMRQGQGIIDVVNSYIAVLLVSGYVGLSLFLGFFLSVLLRLYKQTKRIKKLHALDYHLGTCLIAIIIGVLLTIFTVSSITFIPIVYWSIAAMSVAYTECTKQQTSKEKNVY